MRDVSSAKKSSPPHESERARYQRQGARLGYCRCDQQVVEITGGCRTIRERGVSELEISQQSARCDRALRGREDDRRSVVAESLPHTVRSSDRQREIGSRERLRSSNVDDHLLSARIVSVSAYDKLKRSIAPRKNLYLRQIARHDWVSGRSEEHTSELQSRFGISY